MGEIDRCLRARAFFALASVLVALEWSKLQQQRRQRYRKPDKLPAAAATGWRATKEENNRRDVHTLSWPSHGGGCQEHDVQMLSDKTFPMFLLREMVAQHAGQTLEMFTSPYIHLMLP